MEQPHPDELPTIRANVGQLLQDLKQLATFARPTEQRLQTGSSSEKASCQCEWADEFSFRIAQRIVVSGQSSRRSALVHNRANRSLSSPRHHARHRTPEMWLS